MRVLIVILFFGIFTQVYGQLGYDSLSNNLYVPEEINISSKERCDRLVDRLFEDEDAEQVEDFVYKHNFFLDKLNKSGKVFYNDPIGIYLNNLKDYLLGDRKEKESIKVYLTDYSFVNAFTNDFGSIYFNVGLFSRLNSEEELLAVLGHEISHVLKKHSFQSEAFSDELDSTHFGNDNSLNELKKHAFSRDQELEADSLCFSLLKERGINLNKAKKIFEVLNNSIDLSIRTTNNFKNFYVKDPVLFEFLEKRYLSGKNKYLEITPSRENKHSSHPSIERRLELINKYTSPTTSARSPEMFLENKKLSHRVLLTSYIRNENFIDGIILASSFLDNSPKDKFIQKSLAKLLALYTQQKYEMSPFHQFLNLNRGSYLDTVNLKLREMYLRMNPIESNFLSLRIVKYLKLKNTDPYLDRLEKVLFQLLYKYNESLFKASSKGLKFIDSSLISYKSIKNYPIDILLSMEEDESVLFKKETEENGMIYINMNNSKYGLKLMKKYVNDFPLGPKEYGYIKEYKSIRDAFDYTIGIGKILVYDKVNRLKTRDSIVNISSKYYKWPNVVLSYSSTLCFDKDMSDSSLVLNYKVTSELESLSDSIMKNSTLRLKNISCQGTKNRTNSDNNTRRILNGWMVERLEFTDFIYSKYDEEMLNLQQQLNSQYLLISIMTINSYQSRAYFNATLYDCKMSNLYFDLKSGGLMKMTTYIDKELSKSEFINRAKNNYEKFNL